jgi:hypothetical protein
MSSLLAKVISLSYDSAAVTKTSALKSYYRSVRLIRDENWVNPIQPSYITNVLLCGNCIDAEERNLYVFYIDTFFHAAWIIEINIDSRAQKVVYYDKDNNIGFDPLYKIYNPRVVHGRLVWTDNLNPIYQMDIKRARKSWDLKIGYGQYPNVSEWSNIYPYGIDQIVSNGNNFYKNLVDNNVGIEPKFDTGTNWEALCLIEDAYYSMNVDNFLFEAVPPKHPPVVEYQQDVTRKINNLRQTLFQFAYRYVYMDWRKSTFSPASIVPVPQAEEETATGLANEQISLNNKFQIEVNSGGEEVRAIEIIGRSSVDVSKWFLIETISKFGEQERNNELSRTSEPGYIAVTITIPQPIVTGTNIVNAGELISTLWIIEPVVYNTYISASVVFMTWTAEEFGETAVQTSIINGGFNPNLDAYSKMGVVPSWLTVLNGNGQPLLEGMSIMNGEIISMYPTERARALRIAIITIANLLGDYVNINVEQTAPYVPPMEVLTPIILIDPLDESGLVLVQGSGGAPTNARVVSCSFIVDHSLSEIPIDTDIYWRAVIERDGNFLQAGNGTISSVVDNVQRTVSLTIDYDLMHGDIVTVYLSSDPLLGSLFDKIPLSLTVLNPIEPLNSWIDSEQKNMLWDADEGGLAINSRITCPPVYCILTSKPDWLWMTLQREGGWDILPGWNINTGEIISFYPIDNNLGNLRSGIVVLSNVYGDSLSIIVAQRAAVVPPSGIEVPTTLQVYSGDTTGLTFVTSSSYALSGNKYIQWTSNILHSAHTTEDWTMFWRVDVNGTIQGSGSFSAHNGDNVGEIVIDVALAPGDVVLIDFSSISF